MKAYKHLVKHALAQGHTISVWDGEEWQVRRSVAYQEIVDATESVEEAEMIIRDIEGNKEAWVLCSAFGLADDETVMDYSDNKFMQDWSAAYDKM
jgi:3-hydroxyisobutyrate dehydrogenase-like beta-hydroxyacid dehydrogenase